MMWLHWYLKGRTHNAKNTPYWQTNISWNVCVQLITKHKQYFPRDNNCIIHLRGCWQHIWWIIGSNKATFKKRHITADKNGIIFTYRGEARNLKAWANKTYQYGQCYSQQKIFNCVYQNSHLLCISNANVFAHLDCVHGCTFKWHDNIKV